MTTSDQPTRATLPYAAQGRPESGEQWTERYRGAVMNTFGDPQRVLVRGEGSTVWDVDGNHYLDLLAGIAVNALGHAHPAVVQAVTEQLGTLGHVSNFFTTEPQVRLAERLAALLDPGSDEGADVPVRTLTSKAAYREPFEPLPGDVRWVPYGDADALTAAVDDTVAAVLLEPIQGEAGVVVPPEGYLARARAITREHGALLWIDEVQTGVGRTGAWFAFQESGVVPDLVTLAKGLGGGFPVGACIGIGDAATLLGPGNHGTTFGGNPVACAAALAVLDTIESDGLLAQATTRGDQLASALAAHPRVAEVTGRGLMLGVVLTDPRAADVQKAALDAGLVLNAPTPDRLRIVPPLVLTEAEAAHATTTLSAVISEVLA